VVWQEVPFIPLGLVLTPQAYRRSIRDVVKGGLALFWGVKRA
jgi:peptide/nickel transport system substrate-binding protein